MSFYENDGSWAAPGRQSSWEQQQQQAPSSQQPQVPSSRSGASSSMSPQSDSNAFAAQFEEIDRATDNLIKSGKWFPNAMQGTSGGGRRDGGSGGGGGGGGRGGYDNSQQDPRMGGGGSTRHQSTGGDYDSGARPNSSGVQGYYAGQRYSSGGSGGSGGGSGGGSRQSEAEQMIHAKRRMAAQRERELRNYHQEQQYNRISGPKNDRALSPTTMSEEDRRELIARQHRALYGDTSNLYSTATSDGAGPRGGAPSSQDARASSSGAGGRGNSPLQYDRFNGGQNHSSADGPVQIPPHRDDASPSTNPSQVFGVLADAQQTTRTSNSSPGGGGGGTSSPPLSQGQSKGSPAGVAPIGTRPTSQAAGPPSAGGNGSSANKPRSTTPLTPSSLSYGFNASDAAKHPAGNGKDDRVANPASASANKPSASAADKSGSNGGGSSSLGGSSNAWGAAAGSSGVWGSGKNTLAVQGSVWG